MINCKYEYKGHTFKNEVALDDFLITRAKYESKFGDLVFSIEHTAKIGTIDKANQINKETKDMKKAFSGIKPKYLDGEDISERPKPYIGVTSYLALYLREDESPLYPIFKEEEYWKRRRFYWQDITQDLNEEYNSETGKGVYTKEEKELIFGNLPVERLTKELMDIWQKIITEKWQLQGRLGSDLHHILEMYFRKFGKEYNFNIFKNNRAGLVKLIQKNLPNVDTNIINQVLDFAENLRLLIIKTLDDEELDFFPELKISGKVAKASTNGADTLVGSIDLLVVDSKGNSHIFDYKTSPKYYAEYNSAKVRTFMYQFATYNRILQRFGFLTNNNRQFVAPLLFDNFHLENRDEAMQDPSKAKFTYDGVKWQKNLMLEELTQAIRNDDSLNTNLDDFLPKVTIKDPDYDKIIERVREDMGKLFGGRMKKKSYTNADIAEYIKDVKPNEQGLYTLQVPGGYSNTPIVAKSAKELHRKVKEFFDKIETGNYNRAKNVVDALKYGIKNNTDNIGEYLKYMNTKKLFDETGDLGYFKKVLSYYCNSEWEVVEDNAALYFGMVLLKNKTNKQVDVIKISGKNLKDLLYHENIVNGKKIKDYRRSNLTFAWETDLKETSNPNSRMLKGAVGNVELIESLLVLNLKYSSLFSDETKIGHIQVVNPFVGLGISATNEELKYSYNKLRKYSEIYDGIDRIKDGLIKFASLVELAENDFKRVLELDGRLTVTHKDDFQNCLSILDNAEDNSDKIKAIKNLLSQLETHYKTLVTLLKSNLEDDTSPAARLYNKLLLAYAELNGITFRLQLKATDKWPALNIKKMITKGLASSYIDNPGTLESQTLNTLTLLVTLGYLNVRLDMTEYLPTIRKLVLNLKDSKNFGWLSSRTVGNETKIFDNLFDKGYTNDLVLKRVDDASLNKLEREFLTYFLDIVNTNRHNKSKQQLLLMRDSGDIEYYRIPLARGSVSSEVAMNGLWKTFTSRISKWTPRNALKELRAATEGIFSEEEATLMVGEEKLFEMNNRFSRGDSDEEYRLTSIVDNGINFFERNLETLLLEHIFAYSTKKRLDEVFPMIRAAMTHIKVMGSDELNVHFMDDLEYAKDYIRAAIKSQPIDKNLLDAETKAIGGKIKSAASFMALAFSPVSGLYQTIQALWNDISLIIRKPDGTNAFTLKNMLKAAKIVYKDAFHWSDSPTKISLLNELYAINDMDMNTYMKNIKTDRHGIFNAHDLAFKLTSRPDYYNRMTILVAQMMEDGTWDALEVENGKLVYKFEKDKRFTHFRLGQTSHPDYAKERALYYAIAEQHIREGALNPDGSEFKLEPGKIVPLPLAHTSLEIESFKSLGDLIYGYYAHEKKSLMHYTFYGSFYMLMRTYWSGKKNQYLAPGGVKVQGHWTQAKDSDGKELYYQVIDGKIRTDLELVTENTGAPAILWEGQWLEGIMVTLSNIIRGAYENWRILDNKTDIFAPFKKAVLEKYKSSEDMERMYRNNIRLLWYDLIFSVIIGSVISGLLADWEKELEKDAKDSGKLSDGFIASGANILTASVKNSFLDFRFWESIGGPSLQWTPFSFETGTRFGKNIISVAFGDRTIVGGITNTFSATKQFRPLIQNIAPLRETSE